MNRLERDFGGGEAKLRYMQNEYDVVLAGRYVTCAVTGARIPIEELKYWNADRQEPYASAEVALARYLELSGADGRTSGDSNLSSS